MKKKGIIVLSTLFILIITGYVHLYVLPKGPDVTEAKQIKEETDSFVMYTYQKQKKK